MFISNRKEKSKEVKEKEVRIEQLMILAQQAFKDKKYIEGNLLEREMERLKKEIGACFY